MTLYNNPRLRFILEAFLQKTLERGKGEVAVPHIIEYLRNHHWLIPPNTVGNMLKCLGFTAERRQDELGRYLHFYIWDDYKVSRLIRYVPDPKDFDCLFDVGEV